MNETGSGAPRADGDGGAHRGGIERRLLAVRRRRQSDRYAALLVLLMIDILVIGLAGTSVAATFAYAPLTAAVMLMALRTSEARKSSMRVAWIAAILVVLLSAVVALTGLTSVNGYVYLLLFALLVLSPLGIGRRILISKRVTALLVIGAICVYLMIGLAFTFLYLAINGVHPNFFAQGPQQDPSVYLYFSFVTLTTVGYGDFTAGAALPRVLVIFEAMLGQIYLVTTVARLVSLYNSNAPDLDEPLKEEKEG